MNCCASSSVMVFVGGPPDWRAWRASWMPDTAWWSADPVKALS